MLKRKIYNDLVKWKNTSNGSSALMIDGARRVGKSYIVEEFAKNEYKSYIIIDFGNISKEIEDLFNYDSNDLDFFFSKLSTYFTKKII